MAVIVPPALPAPNPSSPRNTLLSGGFRGLYFLPFCLNKFGQVTGEKKHDIDSYKWIMCVCVCVLICEYAGRYCRDRKTKWIAGLLTGEQKTEEAEK